MASLPGSAFRGVRRLGNFTQRHHTRHGPHARRTASPGSIPTRSRPPSSCTQTSSLCCAFGTLRWSCRTPTLVLHVHPAHHAALQLPDVRHSIGHRHAGRQNGHVRREPRRFALPRLNSRGLGWGHKRPGDAKVHRLQACDAQAHRFQGLIHTCEGQRHQRPQEGWGEVTRVPCRECGSDLRGVRYGDSDANVCSRAARRTTLRRTRPARQRGTGRPWTLSPLM